MDALNTSSESFRILLVDDEPGTVQLVRKILQADGHEVFEAADGQQAIEMFNATNPDLVLLDVVIPKIDGLGVLQEIRRRDRLTGVIMVSALTSEQLAVKSMLSGADDYISKPFKLKTIRMHIRQVMDKVHLRRHNALLQEQLIAANEKLRHYMADPLIDSLMASSSLPSLGGERQVVTVLFMDFCNSTTMAHNTPPDMLLHTLNDYFALLGGAVLENGGFMDKIMGDGFMALFNAPSSQTEHATIAVQTAIDMCKYLVEKNQNNHLELNIRVGIHTGEAVVGNIGMPRLLNYTAIGDTVNLAKRLEEASEPGDILLSAATYAALNLEMLGEDCHRISAVGPCRFKGFDTPFDVFRIKAVQPLQVPEPLGSVWRFNAMSTR
ncbi:MAG: adenylate/guanylate cyclase domain-containing protein [Caldilineaceae bacterium]